MVLIAVLFVVFVGMSIGGFIVWWTEFPGYESEALVECVSNIPEGGLSLEQARLRQDELESVLSPRKHGSSRTPDILSSALLRTEIQRTQWHKSNQRRKKNSLVELTEQLSAGPVRGTNFLRVAIETRVQADAKEIVGAAVATWLERVEQISADEYAGELSNRKTERDDLEAAISEKRSRLQDIASRLLQLLGHPTVAGSGMCDHAFGERPSRYGTWSFATSSTK